MASPEAETFLWRRIKSKGEQAFLKTGSRATRWSNSLPNHGADIYATIFVKRLLFTSSKSGNASTPTEPAKRCTIRIRQVSPKRETIRIRLYDVKCVKWAVVVHFGYASECRSTTEPGAVATGLTYATVNCGHCVLLKSTRSLPLPFPYSTTDTVAAK